MSGFGRKQQPRAVYEKRKSERSVTTASATLVTTADRRSVTLVDISKGGAGLRAGSAPERGRDVQLRVGGHTLFGRVWWKKDGAFGLRFDETLSEEAWRTVVEAIRAVAAQECALAREVALAALSNKPPAQT